MEKVKMDQNRLKGKQPINEKVRKENNEEKWKRKLK